MSWLDWNEHTLERAQERDCPVLLFLRASWCNWCRELESGPLQDSRVQELLNAEFICAVADKDLLPAVDERYRASGWPALIWLDPKGEVLSRSGYLEAAEILTRSAAISEGYPYGPTALAVELEGFGSNADQVPEPEPEDESDTLHQAPELSMDLVSSVMHSLLTTCDPEHGGWGSRQKFPHPDALDFAFVRWSQTGDSAALTLVRNTLRNMQAGEIYDRVEGGFFRYATQPDWSLPQHEKLLDSNAQRLAAYVQAYQALGDESFRKTAEGILGWMHETLLDSETGAFRGSQDADGAYYRKSNRAERAKHGAPACDPKIYCNSNAMAVCALLKSSVVLGRDEYRVQALRTLEFLTTNLWHEREGAYHYWDGAYNLTGILADQAHLLRALIEAMHFAGETQYLDMAVTLAYDTIDKLQADDGVFYDQHHLHKSGRLADKRSLIDNAQMAEGLMRLASMTRDSKLHDHALLTLNAFLPTWKSYGQYIAGYGRAVDLLFHPPVHVTIVGSQKVDRTRALREAALRPYFASRIVQTIDPERDAVLLEHIGLPVASDVEARAYVHQGRESYAETSRPERLAALMARTERSN